MKTYPLRKFIQRVLVVRLSIATAAIALVVGLITYGFQQLQLEREVADLGHRGVFSILEKARFVMEQQQTDAVSAVREVFKRGEPPLVNRAGRFVYIQFYDHGSEILAEKVDADQPGMDGVKAFVASRPFSFPEPGMDEVQTTTIGDASFVLVSAAVADKGGEAAAFVRGLFAVSPQALSGMRKVMIRNTLIVMAIVSAVSALLYPVILRLSRQLADYSTHLLDANLETLSVLGSAIAQRDSDTDAHNYRVTLYATRIGESLGLTPAEMRVLIKGSFLHDVGKLGIPDSILLKPAKLDPQEFSIMKTHVEKGKDIVQQSSWLCDGIDVVGCHHEKFAGGGYPLGLKGEEIPITARIFTVSDVFDALTSHRPYKKPLTLKETMDILERDRGKHFDPAVLDTFGKIARPLFERYAGHGGADLKDELATVVTKYFSAGMETLHYEAKSGNPLKE